MYSVFGCPGTLLLIIIIIIIVRFSSLGHHPTEGGCAGGD